jgi:tetratricopeptide (TPR) repeat protein
MTQGHYYDEIRRGQAAQNAGNLPAALKCFETASGYAPEEPLAWILACDVLLLLRQPSQAQDRVKQALALPFTNGALRGKALRLHALCLLRLNQVQPALAVAKEACAADPNHAESHLMLGLALMQTRHLKDAEVSFQRALSMAPASVAVLIQIARFFLKQGHLEAAMELTERAAHIQPDDPAVMLLRGQIAFRQGNLDTARDMALWILSKEAMSKEALTLLMMVKARQSWLTGPFWWFLRQLHRTGRIVLAVLVGVLAAVLGPRNGYAPIAGLPFSAGLRSPLLDGLFIYALLCVAHLAFLVARERRKVRLKNY